MKPTNTQIVVLLFILCICRSEQQGFFNPTTPCSIDRGNNCCSSRITLGRDSLVQCDVFLLDIATNTKGITELCLIESLGTTSGMSSSLYIADDSNPSVDCSSRRSCTGGVRASDDGRGRCASIDGSSSHYPLRLRVGQVTYEIESPFDYKVGESYQFTHISNNPCTFGC
jgi:hypothetical protein